MKTKSRAEFSRVFPEWCHAVWGWSFTVSGPNYRRTSFGARCSQLELSTKPLPKSTTSCPRPQQRAGSDLFIPGQRPFQNIHCSGNLPRIAKNPASLKPHLECCWTFHFAQNHFTGGGCGLGKRQIIDDFCTTCHNVCACAVSNQQQQDDW